MLSVHDKKTFLKNTEVFARMSDHMLTRIAEAMTEVRFKPDDHLMVEGKQGDAVYLVVDGRIRILKEGVEVLVRGAGECLGEMALLDDAPRSATVEAITEVVALRLKRDEFQNILTGNAAMIQGLYHTLTRKIRSDLEIHVESVRAQEQIRQDMRRAYETQQTMLPDDDLLDGGLHITGYCQPATTVGGDYYDYFRLPGDKVGVFIGDVSGHGFYSGLIVAMAKSCLVTQLQVDPSVESVMQAINRIIYPTGPIWMFMTVCYALIDRTNRCFTYANAGHNNPYHYHIQTGEITPLKPTTHPVGIMEDAVYTSTECGWRPGDLLVFYSDGVIEAENADGEPFGATRLERCIRDAARLPASEIKQAILGQVQHFTRGVLQSDDITLMIAKL